VIQEALRRQRLQKRTADSVQAQARRLWRLADSGGLVGSWRRILPQLAFVITGVQVSAARTADEYVRAALDAQDLADASEGGVNPDAFAGVASDGWPLESLLILPAVQAAKLLQQGFSASRAMAVGQASLEMIAATQVADVFRVADSVAATSRRVQMYTRVLGPRPCSRCIMLAGTQSSWKTAFKRHPQCSCSTLPTDRAQGREYLTDPNKYFESLSPAAQDRIFTKSGAQAIRDGADMNRVVNARRRAAGMRSAADYERTRRWRSRRDTEWSRLAGSEGTVTGRGRLQRRSTAAGDQFVTFEDPLRLPGGGAAPRLMPESIYELASDHDHAIRLLKRHGYIQESMTDRLARLDAARAASRITI
jgi:hypothetical protein